MCYCVITENENNNKGDKDYEKVFSGSSCSIDDLRKLRCMLKREKIR